jgi:hypothetical protein
MPYQYSTPPGEKCGLVVIIISVAISIAIAVAIAVATTVAAVIDNAATAKAESIPCQRLYYRATNVDVPGIREVDRVIFPLPRIIEVCVTGKASSVLTKRYISERVCILAG